MGLLKMGSLVAHAILMNGEANLFQEKV